MSYLERLAMKAAGAGMQVRPRSRSRFEPPAAAGNAESGEDLEVPRVAGENRRILLQAALPSNPPERTETRTMAPAENGRAVKKRITDRDDGRPIAIHPDAKWSARGEVRATDRGGAPSEAVSPLAPRSGTASPALTPSAPQSPAPRRETAAAFAEPPLARGGALRVPETGVASIAPGTRAADDVPRSDLERVSRQVHVTIGRVEVRAVMPEAAVRQPTLPRPPTALSLDEYLRKRGQP